CARDRYGYDNYAMDYW
nr:immunoglobulin heavy chain junction region [Mus musculus]MBK4187225.1 immunoglobulin heavy chain junction region [Mus musculus]MBK4187226.1 immunoglobulin heavy chain junction region [Mus musculus]MBK4187227.1 immunoglobulin heavy chain junction region [Mus musculus]